MELISRTCCSPLYLRSGHMCFPSGNDFCSLGQQDGISLDRLNTSRLIQDIKDCTALIFSSYQIVTRFLSQAWYYSLLDFGLQGGSCGFVRQKLVFRNLERYLSWVIMFLLKFYHWRNLDTLSRIGGYVFLFYRLGWLVPHVFEACPLFRSCIEFFLCELSWVILSSE